MASPEEILVVVILAVMVIVIIAELMWIRKRRLQKRLGNAPGLFIREPKATVEDDAHNALITGRAIARTLERSGTPMRGVWDTLGEAQTAYDRGNYKVTINLVDRAKETMKMARLEREKKGDLAKLESAPVRPAGEDEVLTKETIQKKFPENYMQAKFSISVAKKEIESSREAGKDVSVANNTLLEAERAFDAKDYSTALKLAMQCKGMIGSGTGAMGTIPPDEEVIEITEEQLRNRCRECGEFLKSDDNFCRKCGTKVPTPPKCDECGKVGEIDDKFCRGCGKELAD